MTLFVDKLCKLFAILAGLALCAITLMTAYSVIGRNFFSAPLLGDTELVQVGMAFCIAACLPLCQWRLGNIIVDFFTTNASQSSKNIMDRIGALAVAIMILSLGWRTVYGAIAQKEANATTMLMQVPEWIIYSTMVPPLLFTAFVGFYMAATGTDGKQLTANADEGYSA